MLPPGPGEITVMVWEVTKRFGKRPFQWAEFFEQAWFVTSVTLMPTILVSVPFGDRVLAVNGTGWVQVVSIVAALSMSGSSAIVAINALMLKRTKLAGIRSPHPAPAASSSVAQGASA